VDRPFKVIAEAVGIGEDDVIEEIIKLKEEKIIRQISPIYDTRMLGYDSSLVAFKVEKEKIEECANFINSFPGVSHNYERTHDFNLWFTIAVPPEFPMSLDDTVSLMAQRFHIKEFVILRTLKTFKIGVKLDYQSLEDRDTLESKEFHYVPLSQEEKDIVRVTQEDMPLVKKPFSVYADILGIDEERLLEKLKEFKERGILRRISAILYHRKVGYTANAMVVWKVPKERVEEIGTYLASFKSVSHCYERTTNDAWKYNLFSMIHGKQKEEVESFIERISGEIGIKDYHIIYSVREFKKKRVKYFSEEFYEWHRRLVL